MSQTELDTLLVKFAYDDKKVQDGLKQTDDTMNKFVSKSVKGFAAIAAAWATMSALSGVKDVIVKFEKLEASLRTVTGSSEAATKAFDRLEDFAKKTPFQLDEVIDSFIKMKALGLDPSEKALSSYGNTATAMGKSLNQMIEAVADASTGEFERLKEFGIKSSSQGENVSFTFQGITTTVKKSAADIEQYLQGIGDIQFAGAMAEQADSLGVALSNLDASFESLAKAIGDAGLKELLVDFTNLTTQGVNKTAEAIESFGETLRSNGAYWAEFSHGTKTASLDLQIFEQNLQKSIEKMQEKGKLELQIDADAPLPIEKPEAEANAAIEEAEKERERLANELVAFEEHLMSKEELENSHYERRKEKLAEFLENDLITDEEHKSLKKELDQAHNEELLEIEEDKEHKKWDVLSNSQRSMRSQNEGFLKQMKAFESGNAQDRLNIGVGMMQNMLSEAGKHNKTLFEMNKAAGIANAVVSTAQGIAKAFAELPFPLSLGAAGAIAVAGAAQIATIASTSFNKGGGGSSSASSAAVPAVSSDSSSSFSGEQNTKSTEISISGIDSNAMFSGEQVRELISAINEELGDGTQLNI